MDTSSANWWCVGDDELSVRIQNDEGEAQRAPKVIAPALSLRMGVSVTVDVDEGMTDSLSQTRLPL